MMYVRNYMRISYEFGSLGLSHSRDLPKASYVVEADLPLKRLPAKLLYVCLIKALRGVDC